LSSCEEVTTMVPRGAVLSSFISPAFTRHFGQRPSGASSASAAPHWWQSCTVSIGGFPFYLFRSTPYRRKPSERLHPDPSFTLRTYHRAAECNSAIQQITNLRYGQLAPRGCGL